MNGGRTGGELTRRGFLLGSGAALLLAACSSDDGGTAATTTTTTNVRHTTRLDRDPFQLGVASGDPAADSVVLWTRLAPQPLAEDGLGGMVDDPVDVRWQLATDDRFTAIVGEGTATAVPDEGHSLHVIADGLDPAADYHYRFTVGDFTSPVGHTRTLPAAGEPVARHRLAVANCQYYESGYYAAYRHMAGEDLDLVLHLGDYIYEYPGGGPRASAPTHEIRTLPDYRLRYSSYKVDPDLQAAHAAFPFVATWDDHEVANNYLGDTVPGGRVANARLPERRAAAYRAWWENLPTRLPAPTDDHVDIYQSFVVGNLARITMLDERQYADVAPCRDEGIDDDFGDCDERREDRTRLGEAQESFLASSVTHADTTWNLVGNPVVLAGIDAGDTEPAFYLDTWDGYPDAQRRMIAALDAAQNPVVLTGDYHAGMVLNVDERPFDTDSAQVCTEFMAPPISSVLFPGDVSRRTPQLRQQLNGHGYLTVTTEPEQVTAEFKILRDVQDPDSHIRTEATWRVQAGNPHARQVEA